MSRGFAAVALDHPKNIINIGGVLRAVMNYCAGLIVLGACRVPVRHAADTMKAYCTVPTIRVDDVFKGLPFDTVPVAVDLVEDATPLPEYKHPERAFYIFGAEDQTLGARVLDKCRDTIYVPTNLCMNLAAAVNVVLYDRMVKRGEWSKT